MNLEQPKSYLQIKAERNQRERIRAFYQKVEKKGSDDCWLWKGAVSKNGYGMFWFNQTITSTQRVAYILNIGIVPIGLDVHHLCGNRLCCNHTHLEACTRRQHLQKKNKRVSLNAEAVKVIRYLSNKLSLTQLAKAYKVTRPAIYDIVNMRCWQNVTLTKAGNY